MNKLVVDKKRIRANMVKIRERAGGAAVYAVLKGDAYGLGLLPVAELLREDGVSRFALTEVEDAMALRKAGFVNEEILMLRSTTEQAYIEALAEYNLVGTIGSNDAALALVGIADKNRTVIEAHVKIDTGMGRYGFLPSETEKIYSMYKYLSNVALTGIYTHFSRAYDSERTTRAQADAFMAVVNDLRGRGVEPGIVHAANSSALFRYDFCNFDAVRVGSAITGRLPTNYNFGLQRVGYIESKVAEVRWLPKGCTIGYGGSYKTRRATRIAVIPIGYSNGFCAEKAKDTYRPKDTLRYVLSDLKRGFLGKKLYVTIGTSKARVLGHVGMLHTVADVSNLDCCTGDTATLEINPLFTRDLTVEYTD